MWGAGGISKWAVLVDIGGIDDHHYLKFFFINDAILRVNDSQPWMVDTLYS
jgi:hypothetical protein